MILFTRWTRPLMAVLFLAATVMAIAPDTVSARTVESRKYGVWTYQHFVGDIEWCGVKTNWPNDKMVLTIRLRRDTLDYFFFNREWNLTPNRQMGDTVFVFGRREFHADTETLDSNKALFGTFRANISNFVNRFKRARRMELEFPTRQSIGVNLKGSSKAIDAAIRCWDRNLNY